MFFSLVLAGSHVFSTTYTASGFSVANINGVSYTSSLPGGWSVDSGANWNKLQGTSAVSLRANGTQLIDVDPGSAKLRWLVSTTEPVTSNTRLTFKATRVYVGTLQGNALVEDTGCVAAVKAGLVNFRFATIGVGEFDQTSQNTLSLRLLPQIYSWSGSGTLSTTVTLATTKIETTAFANESVAGGNATVALASGTGSEKVFLADMQSADIALFGTVSQDTLELIKLEIEGQDSFWILPEDGVFGFSTDPYPLGAYNVFASSPYHLRRKYTWTFASSDVTGKQINLPFGDLNSDGAISAAEAGLVLQFLGKTPANPEWWTIASVEGASWLVASLDFNRDNVIDSLDYNMIAPNVGLVAD